MSWTRQEIEGLLTLIGGVAIIAGITGAWVLSDGDAQSSPALQAAPSGTNDDLSTTYETGADLIEPIVISELLLGADQIVSIDMGKDASADRIDDVVNDLKDRIDDVDFDLRPQGLAIEEDRLTLPTLAAPEIILGSTGEDVVVNERLMPPAGDLPADPAAIDAISPAEAEAEGIAQIIASIEDEEDGIADTDASLEPVVAATTSSLQAARERRFGEGPLGQIHFDPGSAELSPGGRQQTEAIAKDVMDQAMDRTVRIVAFTDTTGPASLNKALSEQRAEAIADALIEAGIATDQIELMAKGEEGALPLATNDQISEPLNRAAKIFLVPERTAERP